jgi:nucleoside phosphorylase
MLQILADRALFAERNGAHRLLACSGGVESWQGLSAIEMDLPDSAPAGITWEPFFRGWPQGAFYFFSRTEPDTAARRPGMVRTQVTRLRLEHASNVSDISQLFDYLSQSWPERECAVALSISVKQEENKLQTELCSVAAMRVAERLSRGNKSETPLIIPGENALRDLVIELWSRLSPKIRCSLVFGFSFSPPDLKNRSLHLGCFPKVLERRWHNYLNLLSDISSAPTISVSAAYLLRLPGGKAITDFVKESDLPEPTLEQLAIFERVAHAWGNPASLDFEGWAALVLDLIVIAPQPQQALQMKRDAVEQAVRRIRPGIADDILILRGFKVSALGDAAKPVKEGVFTWFRDCFIERNFDAAKALAAVLEKLRLASSPEWKASICEGLRGEFADDKRSGYPVMWNVWAASESVFEVISPTDLTGREREGDWLAHLPHTLPSSLGEKLLEFCSGINWWELHAGAALKFLSWESAIQRQLSAYTGSEVKPIRLICDAANSKELINFTFKTADQRVWDCTCERCVTRPEIFVGFDVEEPGWLKLLIKTVTHKSDTLKKIKNAQTILYSLLDLLIDGKLENEALLNAFANAGIADLCVYSRRSAVWSKLSPVSCQRFAVATAIGWLASFLKNPGGTARPEPVLLQALFGPELRGQRFISATPNLIGSGLTFFGLFQDAPEEIFQEWLIAVDASSDRLSYDQSNAVLQIVSSRKWENSLRTIQQIANQRRRRDFESLWNAYWGTLSLQEKMLRRLDALFARNENAPPVYSSFIDYSMQPKSSEKATALFITALGLEFNAVRAHLRNVRERTADNVVYAVGFFSVDGVEYTVAVAQAGPGNAEAAMLTERAIKYFSPRYAFFVGIAGGLKDELKLGDVVVAEKVYAYESGKAEKEFRTRPKAPMTGFASLQRAHATSRDGGWVKRITPAPKHTPLSYVKPIAAGEKVVDSHKSDAFLLIKKAYGDAYAVAMEEFGFYHALHANPSVVGAVVRGISDFSQNKGTVEKEKSQEQASANATAFAYEMLAGFLASDAEGSTEKLDYRHL